MEYNKPLALVNTTDTFQLISQNTTSIRLHFIKNPGRLSDDTRTHSYQHIFTAQWQIMQSTITPSPSYCVHHLSIIQVQDGATYCGILLLCLQLWSGEDLALCCCVYICDLEKTWLCAAVFTSVMWKRPDWITNDIIPNEWALWFLQIPHFQPFWTSGLTSNGKMESKLRSHCSEAS